MKQKAINMYVTKSKVKKGNNNNEIRPSYFSNGEVAILLKLKLRLHLSIFNLSFWISINVISVFPYLTEV